MSSRLIRKEGASAFMALKTYLQAIRDAQYEEMARDESVFLMGEDTRCNIFGTSTGLIEAFGDDRVRDTPISEAGMAGVGRGCGNGWYATDRGFRDVDVSLSGGGSNFQHCREISIPIWRSSSRADRIPLKHDLWGR